MKRLLGLLLAALSTLSIAQAERVIWLGAEFPPMAIHRGPHANQGYINALYDYLRQALPEYQFSEQILPWSRAMHLASQGGPYCLIAAFKTPERETYLRFTSPYGYLMPLGLVIHQDKTGDLTPYLNQAGQVELDRLLANPELRPGLANHRSYGAQIDQFLRQAHDAGRDSLTRIYQGDSTRALFDMLDHKRIDYGFGYPNEIVYYSQNHQHLRFYPIAGGDALLPGRFSCTRSPETDRVFAALEGLLHDQAHRQIFRSSYERWLPADLRQRYAQQLRQLPPNAH